MTQNMQKRLGYAALVAPGVLTYGAMIVFPVLFSFGISFFAWTGMDRPIFIGLANYTTILDDPVFWFGLRNNLLIVVVSLFGQIPLGFFLAYILYRKLVRGGGFYESMVFLPITIAAVVVAILWNQVFSPQGIYTAVVRRLTGDPRWVVSAFENRTLAMVPVLYVILWMYTGLYMVIFLANLQKISPSILEAAVIDGATEGQILGRIILPSMTNVLLTASIYAIAGSLKSFDLIFAMTAGGPAHYTEVIAIFMYMATFRYYKYGYGSAASMLIVLLSVGLISGLKAAFARLQKKYEG